MIITIISLCVANTSAMFINQDQQEHSLTADWDVVANERGPRDAAVCVFVLVCLLACLFVCLLGCLFVCLIVCVCMYICMYACMDGCMYVCMC